MSKRKIESLDEVKRLLFDGATLSTDGGFEIHRDNDAIGTILYEDGSRVNAGMLLYSAWYIDEPDEPTVPAPPEGVENAVVCPVEWRTDNAWGTGGFSYYMETEPHWRSLYNATSDGATHFGFPREDGNTDWSNNLNPWHWRGKGDVSPPAPYYVMYRTQVHLTYVCLSQPKGDDE